MPSMNLPVLKARPLELEKRADLRHYLTTYAMDDLDDLRAALGYDKINLDAGFVRYARGSRLHPPAR